MQGTWLFVHETIIHYFQCVEENIMKKRRLLFSIYPIFLFTTLTASAADGELHVASPDWREQIIYFVMIDRFNDGNPANNDQGVGEYDPKLNSKYSGGDLLGIEDKISYIKELGATTVWITPPRSQSMVDEK